MPAQIFIIPPKKPRGHPPLTLSNSEKTTRDDVSSQSVPQTPLVTEQRLSSSDQKLAVMKTIPSVRISPPQPIFDTLFDWDEEDRHFGRRPTFIRRRQIYHERLARIRENEALQHPTVSALVSAPILDPATANGQGTLTSPETNNNTSKQREGSFDTGETQGQTLLHLAAKLGHEEIMRILISETSHASVLYNTRGQTPLLCAIEAGSTSTATILMEQDPLSLTCKDNIGSSVFHYATEQCNDIVLSRAISLLKRLSSSAARMTVSDSIKSDFDLISSIFIRHYND